MHLQSIRFLADDSKVGGKTAIRCLVEEDESLRHSLKNYTHLKQDTKISHPTWVKRLGIVYRKTGTVLVSTETGTPTVGKIQDLVVLEDGIYLLLPMFETKAFDTHYHAFVVNITSQTQLLKLISLKYPFILHAHSLSIT